MLSTINFKNKSFNIYHETLDPNHPSIYTFFDEDSVRQQYWHIEPDDWIIEIGADYGSYVLTALSMGASKVFAWTPQGMPNETPALDMLEQSLKANGWEDKCELYNSGIYSEKGWIKTTNYDFFDEEPAPDYNIIKVEPLDDWYDRVFKNSDHHLAKRFFLKMDIEGMEVHALKSGARFLKEIKPIILVENHTFMKASLPQEVNDLLTLLGYEHISTTPYHSVSHSLYKPKA